MDDKFRSRKWTLTLLSFVTVTGLLMTGFINESIWRDAFVMLSASYFTANVFEKKNDGKANSSST